MVKRVIFGALTNNAVEGLNDVDSREILILSLVAIAVMALGLWPAPLLEVMHSSVENLLSHASVSKL
jgi:NADH-quinone oxidoreductase subunit M